MVDALDALNKSEMDFAAAHGIASEILGKLHNARRQRMRNVPTVWRQLAEWIVAPVLAGFAEWMMAQSSPDRPLQYLGVMREGRLLAQLMQKLCGVPAREVWLNRNLAMLAAFGCGDDEALINWLARTRLQPMTRGAALQALLGETYNDAEQLIHAETAPALLSDWKKSGVLDKARTRAATLAERLVRHWQNTCGDNSAEATFALMDFASVGNIQRSLQTVFSAKHIHVSLVGLNFSMTAGNRWAEEKGCVMRGFLAERGEPSWFAEACARTPELMEIFTATPIGSLNDYEENGGPICCTSFLSPEQQTLICGVQAHILDAAAYYHRVLGKEITSEIGRILWGRLLVQPSINEATAMADWPLDAGLDGNARRVLASRLHDQPQPWGKMQTAWPAASRLLQ